MNFGSLPKIPAPPVASSTPEIPTRLGQDVGAGPAQGNVGIGAPQHFDPNNPSVRLDGTLRNPTGVGGDLHVSREVSVDDLQKIPVPDPSLPSLPNMGGSSSSGDSEGSGGFSLPSLGNPLAGLSMPSLPDLPSLGNPPSGLSTPDFPSLGNPLSGLSMPSLGNPFSGIAPPDLSLAGNPFSGLSLPDFTLPDLPSVGTPGMPGFRFLDLPEISLPDLDMGEWDLPSPDLIPDWDGDSEESQEEPHKNVQKKGRLKVDLVLETDDGVGIPRVAFRVTGVNGFSVEGALDRDGKAQVEVPRGPYRVEYLDEDAIQAKILAAEFAKAIRHEDFLAIPELLDDATDCLSPVVQAYSAYFAGNPDAKLKNDLEDLYTRKGRREEFELVWSHLGNGVRNLQVIDADEDDEP